jgi:heme A synthase
MARLLAVLAIALAILAMARGQQNQFVPLPTGLMPAVLVP